MMKKRIKDTFMIQEGASQGKSIFKIIADRKQSRSNIIARGITYFSLSLFVEALKVREMGYSKEI